MQPDFATLKPISNQPDFNTLTPVTEPERPSGLKAFIQDTTKAFLKLPATVSALGAKTVALGAEVAGRPDIAQRIDKTVEEGIDYGYFGNVKPISSMKEAIATGAELGSYAIGGGGVATAAKTGLKGLLVRGLKEGLKTGAASGGLFSFGQSMQEAESKPMDVAYSTLFGTALGGVAGGILGTAIPLVTKGVKETLKFAKVPELQAKLSEGYQKIFNPTARQIKADTRFGNNSFDFLAQEMPDLPVTVNSNGRVEADTAIEMAKQKYAAEATSYKAIIRNSGKYVDIDNVIATAKKAAREEFDGTDLAKAEQQIENEINAYLSNTPQDVNVLANGKRFVTISRADDIKSYSWARGKGWGTPEAEVWNDTNNLIGHSIKDAIEQQLPEAPIKAMNRRLGQWKNAIDLLEKRNGQVSGSGGKISKYLIKSVGTTVGAGIGGQDSVGGGLTGAGAGFMTASALAALMANPNVRLFAVRQILKRLSNAGKNDMIKEAEDILKQQAQRYLLPAAGKTSYVEKPIIVAQAGQRLESTGTRPVAQSSPMIRQATAPKVAPTIQDTKNVNITNTVDQTAKNASQKGAQQAFGGVAGIEIKKDDNGQLQVSFDPEKAIAGVIGMTAYNKLGPVIKKEVQEKLTKRLKERVIQELKNFDTNPVRIVGQGGDRLKDRMEYGNVSAMIRLDELKLKNETKGLSVSDINETIGLLKRQNIDLMKEEVERTLKSRQIPVSKVDSNLIQEAKKYKTAEEFVKKQPIVYHGTSANLKQFNNKQGVFFTDDLMNAEGYAGGENIYEGYLNLKNPLVIDAKGALHRELKTPYGKTTREIVANVDSTKYDGVIFKNIKDSWIDDADADTPSTIYFAFKPKDAFLNESQLTDIWKKANNKN